MNLGISVVSGGVHADKSKNISGSIHYSSVVKKYPELRERLYRIIKETLDAVYGHCSWCRRMCLITEKLNYDSNEERAIPGVPASGIWLNANPKTEKVHCDANVVGPTFLLTAREEFSFCAHQPLDHPFSHIQPASKQASKGSFDS